MRQKKNKCTYKLTGINYYCEEQNKAMDHGVMSVLLCVCNLSFKIEKESQIR